MKANKSHDDESARLAARAMRRAAKKVLGEAVRNNVSVPLWDGTKVVWKVPKEEIDKMKSADGDTTADS
jgi:hypothetical protein